MTKRAVFIFLCLWLLVACSNEKRADELVQEVQQEHNEVSSVESIYTEIYLEEEKEFQDVYHFEENQAKIDYETTGITLYKDGETYEAEAIEVPDDAYDVRDGNIHEESNPLEDAFNDVLGDKLEDNPEMEKKQKLTRRNYSGNCITIH